jgi:hypothetical protein
VLALQLLGNLSGVGYMPVGDRDDDSLYGRQPHRERARVVFDQHAQEAFHGPQQGAVHHVRAPFLPIFADVLEIEELGEVEVELNGAQLPLPAESIFDLDVDLGA